LENLKLPVALAAAMAVQLAAGVWWVSQQASTIYSLEETVSQLGSRMALEDAVNTKRDVQDNQTELQYLWSDLEDVWSDIEGLSLSIMEVNTIKQRLAILENELKYINRDHIDTTGKK
jgi:hypothetical protein|tara:strand:- start:242 stop:595 length:354 start_codon:yes stop_codon:yes gene_type:complete